MRVVIKLILIVFLFSKTSVAQNPEVVTLLSEINIDSLERSVKELSGALPVFIHGIPDTIHSRHQDSYDNEKAFLYIRQKIE